MARARAEGKRVGERKAGSKNKRPRGAAALQPALDWI
jgi:hypothetical protein